MNDLPVPIPAHLAVDIEPFTDDELDEAIDAIWRGAVADVPAKVGSFELSDEARAEWALRKLQDLTLRVSEIDRQAADWVDRIERDREERTIRLKARAQVFEQALLQYGVNRRLANPKDATIQLPSGVVKTIVPTKSTVHIGNEEAFARWARTNLTPEHRAKVLVDVPHVYVSELRKLPIRVVEADDALHVEYSPTGEPPWTRVVGAYAEKPTIKPSVAPDLSR